MGKRMLQRGPARQRDRKRRNEFTQLALGLATKDTPDGAGGHPIVSTPVLPPKEDTFDTPLIYTGPANYEQYVCQGKGSDSGCLGAETHKMILETPMTGEKALRPSPDTTIFYSGGQSRSYTSLRPRKLEFEEENTMDHTSSKQMMMDANSTRNKVNVIDCVFGEGLRDHVLGSFEYLELINQQHWSVQSNPFEAKESPATMHYSCSPIIIQEEAEKSVDVVQIVSQATQTERRIDLWTYDERLLPGEGYKCKLSIVKSLNDMKMYSLLLVKFQYPGLTEKECMKLVEYGYCVLLNRWLENYEEQDSIVLAQANEIRGFASSVRKRMNSILGQASSWPISFKNKLSFKTFETPREGRAYESQETLDCLKAGIIKNAKEQHAKHMAKAPTGCESLLDAVRPDKVAEVVIQYINKKNEAPSPAQT